MKLEEGMYVRTKDGYIFKIKELLEKGKYNDSDNKIVQRFKIDGMYQKNEDYIETDYMYSDWIKKSNYNIIDLIEVGDYVNGELVEYIEVDSYKDYVINIDYWCKKKDIKSIVTKEQFESVSYKVGD